MNRFTFKKWFEYFRPDEETTTICVNGYTQIVEPANINRDCVIEKQHYFLVGAAVDKLAEYEDAEEEGFLFRFPCRIGDAVFFHWYCSDGTILVFPAEVKQINIGTFMLRKGIQYKIEPKGSPGMLKIFYHSDFGYSIFTTKEEAEAALQKMQEGE